MVGIDIGAIALVLIIGLIGVFAGFGKVLKAMSGGIVGWILSIVVCYFLFGIVLNISFVQELLLRFVNLLKDSESSIVNFLAVIRVDIIVYAIALFLIVTLLRILFVNIIKAIFEIDFIVIKIINKVLGVILALVWLAMIVLIVMQVLYWVTGANGAIYEALSGSFLGLDKLFLNNPLNDIIGYIGA